MSPLLLPHTTGITIDDAVWPVPKCKAFCAVSLLEWFRMTSEISFPFSFCNWNGKWNSTSRNQTCRTNNNVIASVIETVSQIKWIRCKV
jgi:hypothetical protein